MFTTMPGIENALKKCVLHSLHVDVIEMARKSDCSFSEYLLSNYLFQALEYETDNTIVFMQPTFSWRRQRTNKQENFRL